MCQVKSMLVASAVMMMAALPAMAAGSGVTVHRGASVQAAGTHAIGGRVTVHRGSGGVAKTQAGLPRRSGRIQVVGGDGQIWFIDPRRNRLTNCRFRTTSTVGRDEIRCIRRKLPN